MSEVGPILSPDEGAVKVLPLAHTPAARAIITEFERRKTLRLRAVLDEIEDAVRVSWREMQACRKLARMTSAQNAQVCVALAAAHRRHLAHYLRARRAALRRGVV